MPSIPWFKRQGETLPPELENMEVNDLVSAVSKAKEVDTLKNQLAATEAKVSEFDELKSRLAAIEGNRQTPPNEPTTPKGPTSFLDDEDKAFAERLGPFAEMTLKNQAANAKFICQQSLQGLDRKCWEKWLPEIEKVMEPIGLQYQAMPQAWQNALTTIKGRHTEELLKMRDDNSEFFSEDGGGSGSGGPGRTSTVSDKLTTDEEKIAIRMGLKPEEYLKNKKEMVLRAESH